MEPENQQAPTSRAKYAWMAWGSVLAAVVLFAVFAVGLLPHESGKSGGERPPFILFVYLFLLIANVAASITALWACLGIRSWWSALVIVPGVLLAIGIGALGACLCWLGVERSLEGGFWL
jgi:uncharacterized membrane protein YhaH (DUF805 family)